MLSIQTFFNKSLRLTSYKSACATVISGHGRNLPAMESESKRKKHWSHSLEERNGNTTHRRGKNKEKRRKEGRLNNDEKCENTTSATLLDSRSNNDCDQELKVAYIYFPIPRNFNIKFKNWTRRTVCISMQYISIIAGKRPRKKAA